MCLFGGCMRIAPDTKRPPLAMYTNSSVEDPSFRSTTNTFIWPHGLYQNISEAEQCVVPALWAHLLLNEDFWKQYVEKYGVDALRVPTYLRSKSIYGVGADENRFYSFKMVRVPANDYSGLPSSSRVQDNRPEIDRQMKLMLLDMQCRMKEWERIRPWYKNRCKCLREPQGSIQEKVRAPD
jgi:hypothetical protein